MHKEALTKKAEVIFPKLSKFKNFYLVGGTALALQIGHRISVDFDMFTYDEDISTLKLLQKVKHIFDRLNVFVALRTPDQLNVSVDGIRTTFFHYPYPVIGKLIKYRDVPMISVIELAAMKAFSIGKRLSYKDYVDWYFLLKENHLTLKKVIAFAERKYGGDFNDRLFLEQLASSRDAFYQEIDFLRDPVDRKTVEKLLTKTVRDFKL